MSKDSFDRILEAHALRYPLMQPQDYAKLAYQSEFGPGHMISDEAAAQRFLCAEWSSCANRAEQEPEDIGSGLCRFHLTGVYDAELAAPLLVRLFARTAADVQGSMQGMESKLDLLCALPVQGMGQWLDAYRRSGCPAVHHSAVFSSAYAPHYRVIQRVYAGYFPALLRMQALACTGHTVIAAIDGRCGSGKTSLAERAAQLFDCPVLHMDDYYLPAAKRPADFERIPAGNMDLKRFADEVLVPLRAGREAVCRAYDCQSGTLGKARTVLPGGLVLVEGSYAHHPALRDAYDLTVFVTSGKQAQTRRLRAREGMHYEAFSSRWMPMEERYFAAFDIQEKSDVCVDTSALF